MGIKSKDNDLLPARIILVKSLLDGAAKKEEPLIRSCLTILLLWPHIQRPHTMARMLVRLEVPLERKIGRGKLRLSAMATRIREHVRLGIENGVFSKDGRKAIFEPGPKNQFVAFVCDAMVLAGMLTRDSSSYPFKYRNTPAQSTQNASTSQTAPAAGQGSAG